MDIKLSLQTVQQVLAYLGTRPYNEVAGLVNSIAGPAQAQVDEANKAPPSPPAE